jgi:hypothetical protein
MLKNGTHTTVIRLDVDADIGKFVIRDEDSMNPQCFGVLHRKSPAIRDRLKHVDLSCEAFAHTFVKLTTDIQTASHSQWELHA